jgi:hypothetical protein
MSLLLTLLIGAPASVPDVSWLAGYWLTCEGGREVSETWSDPRQGVMLGSSLTLHKGKVSYEQARIGPSAGGLSFFAQPSGQAPAEFPLKASEKARIVFENPKHDFPQRVIYWRLGDKLHARIEGVMNGKAAGVDWVYSAAALNSRCPKD